MAAHMCTVQHVTSAATMPQKPCQQKLQRRQQKWQHFPHRRCPGSDSVKWQSKLTLALIWWTPDLGLLSEDLRAFRELRTRSYHHLRCHDAIQLTMNRSRSQSLAQVAVGNGADLSLHRAWHWHPELCIMVLILSSCQFGYVPKSRPNTVLCCPHNEQQAFAYNKVSGNIIIKAKSHKNVTDTLTPNFRCLVVKSKCHSHCVINSAQCKVNSKSTFYQHIMCDNL